MIFGMTVGIYGIGLETYWPQFNGLKERLTQNLDRIVAELQECDIEVVNLGLVDSPEAATSTAEQFRTKSIELLFLYISTYALSSTVLPVARRAGVPVIVLNIQAVPAIDYQSFNELGDRGTMTGEWLAHCQACCVPEIASVLARAGIEYHLITGHFEDGGTWEELRQWVSAAAVRKGLRESTLGVMGHYYAGMLDVYTDVTMQSSVFGTHIDLIEVDELFTLRERVSDGEIEVKLSEFNDTFAVSSRCEDAELRRAAQTSVALDTLVHEHGLGALALLLRRPTGKRTREHHDLYYRRNNTAHRT